MIEEDGSPNPLRASRKNRPFSYQIFISSIYDSESEDSKSLILFGNPDLNISFFCGT